MPHKILLVDDDPDFIEINRMILESNGYETDTASTSAEALAKVRANTYDLAVIDLIMEELDAGFTIAYGIRENEKTRRLPILMLTSAQQQTGFSFELDKDKEWMKVDDFAAKPLKPAELLQRVQKLLENS